MADSEADIYDIFLEADKHAAAADFVIRTKEDRSTPERDLQAGPYAYGKVREKVSASKVRFTQTVALSRTPKREARKAVLEIRAISVTVKPPHTRSALPAVTYNVVLIEEVGGPQDGTDVAWLLITTLPIGSIDDLQRIIAKAVARIGIIVQQK